MSNIWTIAKRDFKTYFTSPIAYIVIACFIGIMGWMFYWSLVHFYMQNAQYQQFNAGKGGNITEGIILPLYGNLNVIYLMLLPFVTMRQLAEERKTHTIELLITAPVTLWEIVLGKYLASLMLVAVMLGATLTYPIILMLTGNPDLGPILTSYVGTFLLAGCYLAIGIMWSSTTDNQIVAGALTFATGLFFWLISWASQSAGPFWNELLTHLSLISHYGNFGRGILNSSDVTYYASFIGFFLFLTHRVLDSFRWR